MVDWRKYDLVEYRRGRHRLERQTWSFWDWALLLIVVAVVARFWWVFAALAVLAVIVTGFVLVSVLVLAIVSLRR